MISGVYDRYLQLQRAAAMEAEQLQAERNLASNEVNLCFHVRARRRIYHTAKGLH